MQTRAPSCPATCGLCAAIFLAASIRIAAYLLPTPLLWQQNHFSAEPFWWAEVAAGVGFVLASAFVGVRLLYLRPQSVLHGLILGWLCLAFNVFTAAQFIYSLAHNHALQHPEQWVAFLSWSMFSMLFPAVVVWLLHGIRSGERGGVGSLPANLQIA